MEGVRKGAAAEGKKKTPKNECLGERAASRPAGGALLLPHG